MIPASLNDRVSPKVRTALDFALANVGVSEDPLGSNRGPEIDSWTREFGSPLGSPWCALAVGKARKVGGLWIPSHDVGSCNEWLYQAARAQIVSDDPVPGAVVVYARRRMVADGRYAGQRDAVHVGLVLRVTPVLMSIEGNTTLGDDDSVGWVLTLKCVDRGRVVGYIPPEDQLQ